VVEGFYGVPWSWRERESMLRMMSAAGYDTYLYAPKNDPFHRMKWREPYSSYEMERFEALASLGEELGVKLLFGISPFIDFGPDIEGDKGVLLAKVRQFLDVGFAGVAVLADDIEMEAEFVVDRALGELHGGVTGYLREQLSGEHPELDVWFCPTVYSDDRWTWWPDATEDMEAIGEMDAAVRVLWTGPDTFSPSLSMADLERVNGVVGREVAIWDNYWASDGGDGFTGRLPMAPYSGRSGDVASLAILNNPAILGGATRMAVATAAEFQRNPGASDTEMISAAVGLELGLSGGVERGHEADALEWVFELFDAATNGRPGWGALNGAMAGLEAQLSAGAEPELGLVADLLGLFARASVGYAWYYHSGLDADLVDDLFWPMRQVEATGVAGIAALELLGERLSNSVGKDAKERVQGAVKAMAMNRYEFSVGKLDSLLGALYPYKARAGGFVLPASGEDAPACVAGMEYRWRPFRGCDEMQVYGSPGAKVVDDELIFRPIYSGI